MSILDKIVEEKRRELVEKSSRLPFSDLRTKAENSAPARGFVKSLVSTPQPSIIAEVKRASPSKGIIRSDLDPVETATRYAENGAACISILTDRSFFSGEDAFIEQARAAQSQNKTPILRKEFIIETYQVWESRALGADAILLIAAILDSASLHSLAKEAHVAGLDVLVEVHNQEELKKSVDVIRRLHDEVGTGSFALGINNRDLNTFVTSLETTRVLAGEAKSSLASFSQAVPLVAESGIANARDLQLLTSYGADAFLIGESLVSSGDPGENLAQLIKEFQETSGETLAASGG